MQGFDVFYKKDGWDYELEALVRFWVLAVKIIEYLKPMPLWDSWDEGITKTYIAKIFSKNFS